MPDGINAPERIQTSWNRETGAAGAQPVSEQRAAVILGEIRQGGVTNEERGKVDSMIKELRADLNAAQAIHSQLAEDARTVDAERMGTQIANGQGVGTALSGADRLIGDFQQVTATVTLLEGNLKALESISTGAERAQAREIASRVSVMVDKLSYAYVLDWKIYDSEARAAFAQAKEAGDTLPQVITELSKKEGGKFAARLVRELPDAERKQLADLCAEHLDAASGKMFREAVSDYESADLWLDFVDSASDAGKRARLIDLGNGKE